jgi:hypothetical protein
MAKRRADFFASFGASAGQWRWRSVRHTGQHTFSDVTDRSEGFFLYIQMPIRSWRLVSPRRRREAWKQGSMYHTPDLSSNGAEWSFLLLLNWSFSRSCGTVTLLHVLCTRKSCGKVEETPQRSDGVLQKMSHISYRVLFIKHHIIGWDRLDKEKCFLYSSFTPRQQIAGRNRTA